MNTTPNHSTQSMELTKSLQKEELIPTQVFLSLTTSEKDIALACLESKIKELSDEMFIRELLGLIGITHFHLNYKFDKIQVGLSLNNLCSELKKKYSFLSFSEIKIAFNNGYQNEYGEYFGLCNKTYLDWLKAYNISENRLRAKKAIEEAKAILIKKQNLSENQKEEIVINGIIKKFNDFKAGINIDDYGNVAYNYLVRKGHLNFTKERKLGIMNRTVEEMKAKAILDKNRVEKIEVILEKTMTQDAIKINSKKNALKEYFRDLIEMENELPL